MALDPNIGRIKFLRSKTAGRLPTTADIDEGELALNLVDRTIYTRNGNNIIDMGFGKGGQVNGNITASGTVKATKLEGPLTGNAASATILQTARTFTWSGDATGSLSFNGSANVSAALTLVNNGVTAGTYGDNINAPRFTVDAKGRVTSVVNTALRTATTGQTGIVQLNDTLTSTSTTLALTANQGKVLKAEIDTKASKSELNFDSYRTLKFDTLSTSDPAVYKLIFPANYDGNVEITLGSFRQHILVGKIVISGAFNTHGAGIYRQYLQCIEEIGDLSKDYYVDPTLYFEGSGLPTYILIYKKNVSTSSRLTLTVTATTFSSNLNEITLTDITGTVPVITDLTNKVTIDTLGNAGSATILQTARTFTWNGDATGSLSFNGSANVSTSLTLANTGVTAGTYKSVTVDSKGRVTGGNDVITGLITSTSATGVDNAATSNTNTYLNIVETIGSSATTVGTSTQVTGAGTVTVTSDTAGKLTITGSQNITGNAATATSLQTARTINDVAFNGTANITIADNTKLPLTGGTVTGVINAPALGVNNSVPTTGAGISLYSSATTGQPLYGLMFAGTPTFGTHGGVTGTWATYFTMNGETNRGWIFKHGTGGTGGNVASISSTGVITASTFVGSLTGNADSATKLQTSRTIGITGSGASGSISFDGTGNVNIPLDIATQPTTTNNTTIATTAFVQAVNIADTGSSATSLKLKTARTIGGVSFDGSANINLPGVNTAGNQSTTGNAATATALQTARTINGVSFNGTTDIQIDAIRVGTITWHLGERSSIFAGDLSLDGQILNRADYAELWDMVSSGRFKSVTDAVWLDGSANRGCYSTGNGTTTFRLPDLNGMQVGSIQSLFLRGSSTTPVGTVLSDAIRNITGVMGNIRYDNLSYSSVSGVFEHVSPINNTISYTGSSNTTGTAFKFDASKVVPTDDENRPKSVFGIWVVSAKGSNVVVPGGSTAATLTGGNTFQGSQTINGDLIVNQNETVKGNLTVEGLTADRFGLHDKMHWVGACIQPYGTSVLNASVTTNTFQVIIKGESGAKYWTKGRTKLHFIINHGTPQNARFVTATVTDWSTTDSNKQTITATLSLVNHDMPLNTVFHWVGSTYESFGCDWAGWMNSVGGSRLVMRLKPTTPLKSLTPIITSSCSSDSYWNASQLSQPGVEPQQRSEMGSTVINSVHEGDVVFAIGVNNNDRSVSNEYVSISVKDFV